MFIKWHKILEETRNLAFWLYDISEGNRIKKHLSEINKIIETPDDFKISRIINKNLCSLLNHATETTKFYLKYKNKSIENFPVINKSIIKNSEDDFKSLAFKSERLFIAITSGSTGTPFKTFYDKNKKYRNNADTIYFARLSGYEIGHKLIYLKIWAKEKMSHPFKYWLQNIVPVDVIYLNDKKIEKLIKHMESSKSTFGILGYASALELICQYLDKKHYGKIKTNVKSIISISETLNDYTKVTLEKYFGVPVVARYSNLENGIIAQQELNESGRYLVNTASYYLEILKMDSDEKAKPGESGRIVVTDLFNYAMPMIRYDTGDIGAYETDPKRPGLIFLSKVEGRKLDQLYDTKGNLVSSYIMYKNMWKYTEIKQYQLIQQGEKEYIFKINIDKEFTREKELISEFKTYLGSDAKFIVKYVDEIPLLTSGKRRKVVNNYKPS